MITMCLSVNLSGRQELRIWEAGIISDSLIGLLERIFLEIHVVCCRSMQNDQLDEVGVW